MPSPFKPDRLFYVTNHDTIKLNLYSKPTIVYDVKPAGTTTTININGNVVSAFPHSENVLIDDLNTIIPTIDPNYNSGSWSCTYNLLLNASE